MELYYKKSLRSSIDNEAKPLSYTGAAADHEQQSEQELEPRGAAAGARHQRQQHEQHRQ